MSKATTGEASSRYPFEPLAFARLSPEEALQRSQAFLASMRQRRSIRAFAPDPVPFALIENAIATAATAPSGANQQPWRFVVVADPALKRRMRELIEQEERENYAHRFPAEWLAALAPLGTDWHKEFLEVAPYIIVVFREEYGLHLDAPETHIKHYYTTESVGIAVGLLIASLHQAGLATLTHTPNPMGLSRRPPGPLTQRKTVCSSPGWLSCARVPCTRPSQKTTA